MIRLTQSTNVFRMSGTGTTARLTATEPVVYRMRVSSPSNIGADGPAGPAGPAGPTGPGVAAGGTIGQVMKKQSATDYDTAWEDEAGGLADAPSDGTTYGRKDGAWAAVVGTVISVNGQTGVVVLDTDDIAEGTNLYYTEARVAANTDVAANTAVRHTHVNQAVLDALTDAGSGAVITALERTKLSGIEAGAQVNTVDSVNTQTGAVVLDSDDVAEGSVNLYNRVPAGGSGGQYLRKVDGTDFNTTWVTLAVNAANISDWLSVGGDFGTAVATTTNVSLNTLHRLSTSNPHGVTAAALSDINTTCITFAGNQFTGAPSGTPSGTSRLLYEKSFGYWKEYCTFADLPVSTATNTALGLRLLASANLSDVASQQTALNNLTAVAGATNEYVLTKDTGTGDAVWKAAAGGGAVSSVFGRTGAVVAATNDYTWAQIDKTTSSLADITTRSHTALTDIGTNTHAQIDTHIATVSGNPHSVTLADVGGTTDHTALSNIGTNTHAQIDTHLALVAAHIDWTGATSDLLTTGVVTSQGNVLNTGSRFFADLNVPISGFPSNIINGVDIDIDAALASGSGNLTTMRGMRFRYDVVDSGAVFNNGIVQIIDGRINANSVIIDSSAGNQPMYYEFSNPATTQAFSEGFMRVKVAGGSSGGTSIAFFSDTTVGGSQSGVSYRGYATSASGATASLIGVQGYILAVAGAAHSEMVALEGRFVGSSSTPADKMMGLRAARHALVGSGSLVVVEGAPTTPNAVSTGHLDFLNNTGEAYIQGNTELDGELFCDGNESHSLVETTTTPYTAAGVTYIMVDATAGNKVVNLPALSGLSGNREYVVKKIDSSANTVTVDGNASETIDGSTTNVLSSQYDGIRVIAGGTEWHIVGSF